MSDTNEAPDPRHLEWASKTIIPTATDHSDIEARATEINSPSIQTTSEPDTLTLNLTRIRLRCSQLPPGLVADDLMALLIVVGRQADWIDMLERHKVEMDESHADGNAKIMAKLEALKRRLRDEGLLE